MYSIHIFQPCAHKKDLMANDDINDYSSELCPYDNEIMYYDSEPSYNQKIMEYISKITFVKDIVWHKMGLCNYKRIIKSISELKNIIVFNLCDGNDHIGWVGASLIEELEFYNIPFTGSSSQLFKLDESKKDIKKYLMKMNVSTPKYVDIDFVNKQQLINDLDQLHFPVLVKPSYSGGSIGLTNKCICYSSEDAFNKSIEVFNEYGPVYVEEYITGREFTIFCYNDGNDVRILKPLERVFESTLGSDEKFLSYDTKWNQWLKKWWYKSTEGEMMEILKQFAKDVFVKAKLNGYARYDIREYDNKLYVIDVNVNCSMDVNSDTALQIILKSENMDMSAMLEGLFMFAVSRI